ncbi:hypothetical protein Tco_1538855 [Tanacetum coccineum]
MASSSNRRGNAKTTRPWTTTEEIALCKAWCEAMENYNARDKRTGFWEVVFDNFKKEMGRLFENTIPSLSNGKIRFVLKLLPEFQNRYGHAFTMEAWWRILKNHEAWTEVEMPTYQ